MRKKWSCWVFLLFLACVLIWYIQLPDYCIYNSISSSNQGIRETELKVIVYQFWNTDEVLEEIEREFISINGTPSKLVIRLYYPRIKQDFAEPFKIKIYRYIE